MKPEMPHKALRSEHEDVVDAAAQWHTLLEDEDTSPRISAEFAVWLAADPRHRNAFDAVERMWSSMGNAHADPRILDLRGEALRESARPRVTRMAAAAIVLMVIGSVFFVAPQLREFATRGASGVYHTAVGERSTVTLSDGSSVTLNTNSRIEVTFMRGERRVHLLSGQAWFRVAKNPARPFIVEAGDQQVT